MDNLDRDGACLCGSVGFKVRLKSTNAHVCHCGMCRKCGSGGPAITIDCDADVSFVNTQDFRWYKSSDWAQRGFCAKCGSSLFYKLEMEDSEYMNVSVSALHSDAGIVLKDHIYIDSKPTYYDFADDCPRLTEAELLAQFQGDPK